MANDGAAGAIERLERALRRVEAAAGKLTPTPETAALAARHQKLQDEVEAAVAGLDRLIAAGETR